jgi:hypothetical protein
MNAPCTIRGVEPKVDSGGRLTRQGTVSIAPSAWNIPDGRMVDPETSRFWVSWQIHDAEKGEGGVLEDAEIVGADAAIAWGRERADEVFIRLGDTGDTDFSAGAVAGDDPIPRWPPSGPPSDGWFHPSEPSFSDGFPDGSSKLRP